MTSSIAGFGAADGRVPRKEPSALVLTPLPQQFCPAPNILPATGCLTSLSPRRITALPVSASARLYAGATDGGECGENVCGDNGEPSAASLIVSRD